MPVGARREHWPMTAATSAGLSGSAGYLFPAFGAGVPRLLAKTTFRTAFTHKPYSIAPAHGLSATIEQKPYYFVARSGMDGPPADSLTTGPGAA